MAEKKVEHAEGDGGAFKRVDQTQGEYDDSALQKTLADLADSERKRVENDKPDR
jgi:hypothetical protein